MNTQKIAEAWKAVIAAVPVLVYAVVMLYNAAMDAGIVLPPWVATLVSFLTALGVYFKANGYSVRSDTSTPGPESPPNMPIT